MAQSYTTDDGITLYEPGAVVSTQVISGQGGIASAGVVTLIGESEEGPHWSEEEDLDRNLFGPDQISDVVRKYGSGRLVDAFRTLVAAANDPAIVGAVSEVKLVKTNVSNKAEATFERSGFGDYAKLQARRAGLPGNLIKYRSEVAQSEAAPSSGLISYTPKSTTGSFKLRMNGQDQKTVTLTANMSASSLVAAMEDITKGILANGGDREDPMATLSGVSVAAAAPTSSTLTVTLTTGSVYAPAPSVGDTVVIPASGQYLAIANSAIIGAANANEGSYIVTSVVNTASNATLSLKAINIVGPSTVAAAGAINAQEDDIIVFKPIQVSNLTGMDRNVADSLTPDWAVTLNDGTNAVMEITTAEIWTAQPRIGDTLKLSSTFSGLTAGFYYVTASTEKTVSITRLSAGSSGTTGTAASAAAGFTVEKPIIDGLGKSMEVDGDVDDIFKTVAGDPVSFSDSIIYSSAEYINATTISKDTVEDTFESGGNIIFTVGTTKTSAKVVINATKIEFWEGATLAFEVPFAQYTTMANVVDFINSKATYSAALGSSRYSSKKPSDLDQGTFYISSVGWRAGRIKADAVAWATAASGGGLASASLIEQSGLPEEETPDKFLSGGTRGSTSGLAVSTAIDACDNITTNFVVSLFSKDATDDITDSETDSASSYTVDSINALMRNHAVKNSALKAKKNRICLVSKEGAYSDQREAASEVGSFRVPVCIQNVKAVDSQGKIKSYQPWMASVVAAGMQAAAGYKGIVKKFANVNGVFHKAGDFNSKSLSQREDALKSGLLILESVNTGGFRWVSDQTSYTIDNNFVFNSLQAVYIADLMALTLIERFERVIVGKSVADISAAAALGFLESELFNFKRLKWISASSDAPKGYKNTSIRIQGGVMRVSTEVKLAGLIYFVPINLAISEVTQEAAQ